MMASRAIALWPKVSASGCEGLHQEIVALEFFVLVPEAKDSKMYPPMRPGDKIIVGQVQKLPEKAPDHKTLLSEMNGLPRVQQ